MNGTMILIRGLCKISFMESSWASIIARNRSNQPSLITIYYGFCIPFDARFLIKKVLDEVRKTRLEDRKGTIKKRERKYHCYETDERKRTRLSCPRFLIMRKRKGEGRKKKG